jgi:hypothetical protein
VWEEDFENPPFDDWFLQSYNDHTGIYLPSNYSPIIADGTLQMPWNNLMEQSNDMLASALHNSSVAYGTWSFDFHITEGQNHESLSAIFFIVANYNGGNFNLSGSIFTEISSQMRGYIIYIKSGTRGWDFLRDNSITLRIWTPTELETLVDYQFSSRITGFHNMTITRNSSQGEFHVYVDSEHLFQVTNNKITSSEVFEFGSWVGDILFDNLTVSNTVEIDPPLPTTTPIQDTPRIEFGVLILGFVFSVLYVRKRKR